MQKKNNVCVLYNLYLLKVRTQLQQKLINNNNYPFQNKHKCDTGFLQISNESPYLSSEYVLNRAAGKEGSSLITLE